MAVCINCGKELPDGISFCSECGARIERPKAPATTEKAVPDGSAEMPPPVFEAHSAEGQAVPPQKAAPYQAPPAGQQAPPPYQTTPAGQNDAIGTGYFFGMMFVYAIPVVGWIVCIIKAFSGKNETKKHFAKAVLIWLIIGIVLAILVGILITWIGGLVTDYVNNISGGQMQDLQELLKSIEQFETSGAAISADPDSI